MAKSTESYVGKVEMKVAGVKKQDFSALFDRLSQLTRRAVEVAVQKLQDEIGEQVRIDSLKVDLGSFTEEELLFETLVDSLVEAIVEGVKQEIKEMGH